RLGPRWLLPVYWFHASTREPVIGFTVKFVGAIPPQELGNLRALLVSRTNTMNLTLQNAAAYKDRGSFIICWSLDRTPEVTDNLELRICSSSGTDLARITLPPHPKELAYPIFASATLQKLQVKTLLEEFVSGKKRPEETLRILHALYNEYRGPE